MLVFWYHGCLKNPMVSVFTQVKALNKLVYRFSSEMLDFKK
jgi:hypothetical protein